MTFIIVSPEQASVRPSSRDPGRVVVDYFGRSSVHQEAQGFVITMQERTLGAHFHPVDQFQILLGQPGSLYQRHAVGPLVIHYADAYTTYGPLRGEDPPLRFFTLRSEATDVTAFMPKDRELLRQRGRRKMHIALADPSDSVDLPAGQVDESVVFPEEADGLLALELSAGPGAVVVLPAAGANGQSSFVAAGTVLYDGQSYPVESLGWHGPGAEAVTVTAGPTGCRIVVLRYPTPATNSRLGEEDEERTGLVGATSS